MKRLMKKIGICLFTIAILLGTVPLTSVKATEKNTITIEEAITLIEDAFAYHVFTEQISIDSTEQELKDIADEAIKGKNIACMGSGDIDRRYPTEEQSGLIIYQIFLGFSGGSIYNRTINIFFPRLPKEGEVAINEANFPDQAFREYIKGKFDTNPTDGVLSVSELAAATSINISANTQIKNIKGIEYFTDLEELYCWETSIESLDLTKNKKLTFINCGDNQNLTSLNIMGLESLEVLMVYETGIKELDISINKKLKSLNCWDTEIIQLDVSSNLELLELQCSGAKITELDLSQNKALMGLGVGNTDIRELDISANLDLEWLACDNTNINILDVSQHKNLEGLACMNSPLAYLNIGNNEKLTTLNKTDSTVNLDVVGSSFNIKEAFNGIDPNKMIMISGGELDKETGIISHYQIGTPIVYKYHCGTSGNGEETMQVTLNLNVKKGDSSITLHKDLNKTYDGQPIEVSEADITVKGSSKPITFIYEEKIEGNWVKLESAPSKIGTYRVKIGVAEDEFYHLAEIVQEFVITNQVTAVNHEVPPTGDSANIGLDIGMLLLSAGVIAYNTKRTNKQRKV